MQKTWGIIMQCLMAKRWTGSPHMTYFTSRVSVSMKWKYIKLPTKRSISLLWKHLRRIIPQGGILVMQQIPSLSLLPPLHTCVCTHILALGIDNSSLWLWKAPAWFLSLAIYHKAVTSVPPYWSSKGGMYLSINILIVVTIKMVRNYWVFKRCNGLKPEKRKFFLCFRRKRHFRGKVSLTIT